MWGPVKRSARAVAASRVVAAAARRVDAVIVLAYHRVGRPAEAGDPEIWSATAEQLDRQLELVSQRFDVIPPSEVGAALARGGRYVTLTFDDGYRDFFDTALPVLLARGAPAGLFVCSELIGTDRKPWWDEIADLVRAIPAGPLRLACGAPVTLRSGDRSEAIRDLIATYKALPESEAQQLLDELRAAAQAGPEAAAGRNADRNRWLTWEELRTLSDAGIEVGNHTATHPILSRLPEPQQRQEILSCSGRIESELGTRPALFSYPVGQRPCRTRAAAAALAEAGVRYAFSCYGGSPTRSRFERFDVPRVPIGRRLSEPKFASLLVAPGLG